MVGGSGADTFVFDLAALIPAQPGSGVVDRILDYSLAEGDTFDFSALLSAGSGQTVGNLVRVLENPSGTAAILQIDQDGAANGARWTTIAQLDGVHTGDGIKVIFDASHPAATLATAPALVPTHDFNGDGKSDILWQNDNGLPAIWTMDGTTITAGAFLSDPGPTWHVAAAADFNGDGKSDILWQNDSGLPAIWTMDGTTITGGAFLYDLGPTWHVAAAADFNGDGKSDILWQNDNGLPAIWTMDGTTITGGVLSFPILGPRGMSLRRPISTATASPTFFGRTTAACRRSGPWTAPRSLALLSFTMLGPPGMSLRRPISTATASPTFFGRTTAACRRSGPWTAPRSLAGAVLPNPGPTWHVAAAADFNGDGKSDILWQNDSGLPQIWTMDGTTITDGIGPSQSWQRLALILGRYRFGEIWRWRTVWYCRSPL